MQMYEHETEERVGEIGEGETGEGGTGLLGSASEPFVKKEAHKVPSTSHRTSPVIEPSASSEEIKVEDLPMVRKSSDRRSPRMAPRLSRPLSISDMAPMAPEEFNRMYAAGKPLEFRIYMCDLQRSVCKSWLNQLPRDAVANKEVVVNHGNFEELVALKHIDCIASTSNSFGVMHHGFDKSILDVVGAKAQSSVQKRIISEFDGEQPVGTSFIVQTRSAEIPFLAHAPTMRIHFSIRGSDNVYLAMKALLKSIKEWNFIHTDARIRSVVVTGMGSFYGGLSSEETARQMITGFLLARMPVPSLEEMTWEFAQKRQQLVRYGGFHGMVDAIVESPDLKMTHEQQEAIVQRLERPVIKHALEGGQSDDHREHGQEVVFGTTKVTQHKHELQMGQGGRKTRSAADCVVM